MLLAGACLSLGLGAFVLSGPKPADGVVSNVEIIVRSAPHAATAPVPPAASTGASPASGDGTATRGRFTPVPEWTLRNAPRLLNREERGMQELLERYWTSSPRALLFGIASDASIVYAPGSSVWYRVLTDFGLVGLLALPVLFGFPVLREWRYGTLDAPALLFATLFAMSFYQRPIIWLPAQLLIYLAGVCRPGGAGPTPAPLDRRRPG